MRIASQRKFQSLSPSIKKKDRWKACKIIYWQNILMTTWLFIEPDPSIRCWLVLIYNFCKPLNAYCIFPWPCGLRLGSAAARMRVWFPPRKWMSVCSDYCVLSGRGLCNELIPRPESPYRVWCVCVTSKPQQWGGLCPTGAFEPRENKMNAYWTIWNTTGV